jgi:hypothetical protein
MHLNTLPRVIPLSLLRAPIFWFRLGRRSHESERERKEVFAAMAASAIREWGRRRNHFCGNSFGEKKNYYLLK